MIANDMKKGMRVVMRGSNWYGHIMDNKKGNIRSIEVEGYVTETGDNYIWKIAKVEKEPGVWDVIELTDKQKKSRDLITAFGW